MKRLYKIYFVLILAITVLLFNNVVGQISFKINEMNVSNIKVDFNLDAMDEDLRNGPYVLFECDIINNTESLIVLYPSDSETNVWFNYKGEMYFNKLFSLPFLEKKTLELMPNQNVTVVWGIYILLGTPILKVNHEDYTTEMLEILPTLKVIYRDKNLEIEATEVSKVNVFE